MQQLRAARWKCLKPEDSFGGFEEKKFSIYRKYTKPSESTIKPTENSFEWHVLMQ